MGICDSPNTQGKSNPNYTDPQKIVEQAIPSGKINPVERVKGEVINKQLEEYICKINLNKNFGTGFFCKISIPGKSEFFALITNKSTINKEELLIKRKIELTFDNNRVEREINITSERKIYSSTKYDITIIEIFPKKDDIQKFLEIEIVKTFFYDESIYILQYINGINCAKSFGKVTDINVDDRNVIYHNCSKVPGGPILCIDELKVIGINIKNGEGILLREPIKEFYEFSMKNEMNKNSNINCIDCFYTIENGEEFNLLHDYNRDTTGWDEALKTLYNEAKKKKKFLEENTEIYIDSKPIKFNFKYKATNNKIHVKFIFKQILKDLSFMFYDCTSLESIDLSLFDTTYIEKMNSMFMRCSNLKYANLTSIKTKNVINMEHLFANCEILKTIEFPSHNMIIVNDINRMFFCCSSLESIDLSLFNTINVKDMSDLFNGCFALQSINISSFNTSNVKDMSRMFHCCSSLKSIDISKFNTKNVLFMKDMFMGCQSLLSLDLSSFNTTNVQNMVAMFMACKSIKSLNLSSFNTINVLDMSEMFSGCESLISIDLSSFNTRNVTNMSQMFFICTSIKSLDLSSFETPNVTNIELMFYGCKNLESLDLSSFSTINVNKNKEMMNKIQFMQSLFGNMPLLSGPHLYNIFFGCLFLKSIKCKDKYILDMFEENRKNISSFNK